MTILITGATGNIGAAELELFACWKQGTGSAVTDAIAHLTHHPATTYEEFAQYYAQDFFAPTSS